MSGGVLAYKQLALNYGINVNNQAHLHFTCSSPPNANFPAVLSSATPLHASLSGPPYPAEVPAARTMQKRKQIAGVDQDELLDPTDLADPDSCFCEFKGVHIHHKVYDAQSQFLSSVQTHNQEQNLNRTVKFGFPMILLHGFGASVFSWSQVLKPLAHIVGSKVLAFDRPAFGLTSRLNMPRHSFLSVNDTKPLNPYSMTFSVLATLHFIDLLKAEKAILVGHSAGSVIAVESYFEAPERVAALILVAPAILAPVTAHDTAGGSNSERNNQIKEGRLFSYNLRLPFVKLLENFQRFVKYLADAIMRVVKVMTDILSSLYKKALSAILRSTLAVMLVRMIIDKFGIAAIKSAWYDSKNVSEECLKGYTKPLRSKNWDKALLEFTAAMLVDSELEAKPPLTRRLHEISCPVLIVTGDTDRLVPAWNSEKLSRAIPGSSFEIIKNCGHLPHEEKVEDFVSIVDKFLQRAFGGSEGQVCSQ